MKADAVSFLENFIRQSVGAQYVIPVYQRNYNWKKTDQVKKLLDDIIYLMEKPEKQHFMGTVVYVVTKNDLNSQERSVVDGQQRLTTIFLVLYALKSIAFDRGKTQIGDQITHLYLENPTADAKHKLRLKPSVSDDEAFKEISYGNYEALQYKNSRVYENFTYIKEKLEELVSQKSFEAVVDAMRRLYIVYIILEQDDNPQQIFESINSTGMELTAADLIRNYILMNKTNDVQEFLYNKYWKGLEQIFFGSKKLENFFRMYLATKKHSLVNQKKLYKAFQEFWQEVTVHTSEEVMLKEILTYAKHYHALYFAQEETHLGEALEDYRNMASEMPAPFVMEVFEWQRKGKISDIQVKETLKLINAYLVRRYITGKDTSDIARFFPSFLKHVTEELGRNNYKNLTEICKRHLINKTKQKSYFMPDDEQVKAHLMTTNAYTLKHTRWLLEKIEMHNNTVKIVTDNLSIEHIMPQSMSAEWAEVKGVDPEKYEDYINRLGNLTLASIPDNVKMGNQNFKAKKAILKETSHIKLNQPILQKQRWGFKEIDKRSDLLINKILELFPYEKSALPDQIQDDTLYIQYKGQIIASGHLRPNNKIEVDEGSQIIIGKKPETKALYELRREWLDKEILAEEEGVFKFTENQTFNTLAAAAEFILGSSKNGGDAWRTKAGKPVRLKNKGNAKSEQKK